LPMYAVQRVGDRWLVVSVNEWSLAAGRTFERREMRAADVALAPPCPRPEKPAEYSNSELMVSRRRFARDHCGVKCRCSTQATITAHRKKLRRLRQAVRTEADRCDVLLARVQAARLSSATGDGSQGARSRTLTPPHACLRKPRPHFRAALAAD